MATQWFTGGSLPPPPGVEPDFDNPPSQEHGNIALHTVFLTVVTCVVALRLFTRLKVLRTKLGMDDLCCGLSFCLNTTFSGLMLRSCSRGIGRHMWDVPLVWLTTALKYFTVAQYIFLALTAMIKLSFLFFYYRIFPRHDKIKYFIAFGVLFVLVSHITLLFCTIFSCSPVSHAWDAASPGRCWDPRILPYVSGALSTITDIYVLILPIRSLWGLNMTTRRKLRLAAIFSLGSFACVASIVRLSVTHVLTDNTDATWNISRIGVWAAIEANVGIICACLPLVPPFLDRYWPKDFGSSLSRLWSSKSRKSEKAITSGAASTQKQQSGGDPSGQNFKLRLDEREVETPDSEYSREITVFDGLEAYSRFA